MTLPCKIKRSPRVDVTQQHEKGTKFHKKRNISLLVHIVELSTAVVNVDIKVKVKLLIAV